MSNTQVNLTLALITASFLLMSCGKSHVNYSPTQGLNMGKSSSSSSGRLPSGHGGHVKTGKPYQIAGKWYYPLASATGYNEIGTASWYGTKFHGKKTANGERYDMHAMSAAHKTLPLPSMVRVTNLENGRSVVVRVNDRGPFVKSRIIDLSYAAAISLGYDQQGTARVRVETLSNHSPTRQQPSTPRLASNRTAISTTPTRPAMSIQNHQNNASQGNIYVQLGAFSSRLNARQLKETLSTSFPNARIHHVNGADFYRVRIGPYQNPPETEQVVLTLQEQGYNNAIVVIE